MFSVQIFQENTFLKTKPNFSLTGKCFPLTNFSNGKQTQGSLESGHSQKEKHFSENQTKFFFVWKVFFVDRKVFLLTGKYFSLTNFSNDKQTQKNLNSNFSKTIFQKQTCT